MTRVFAFRGVRYARQTVPDLAPVVCPPYDVIAPEQQARLQARSPLNAVHLELPADEPAEPGSRYRAAAERWRTWRRTGVLRLDERPTFTLHETTFEHQGRSLARRDLLAAVPVEPWSADGVLPHEHTMPSPKADRLALLEATRANFSPLWLLYPGQPDALAAAWARAQERAPSAELELDGERHRLWVLDEPAEVEAIERGFDREVARLYIADGHHRYETALAYRRGAGARVPGAATVLAALTSATDAGLLALPTHRLLAHLDPALTLEDLEVRWSDVFHYEYYPVWDDAPPDQVEALMRQLESQGRTAPTFGILGPHQADLFGMLALRGRGSQAGNAHARARTRPMPPPGSLPDDRSEAWRGLDVAVLEELVIGPLVRETGRPREQVLSYTRDPVEAFGRVRSGQADAAFFLNPTPVAQVLAVADAGDRMPEKSTYFHPKPPTGLVMRDLEAGP
jgi:uncharacterized protein (DUF1015 family)